ncbi:MAG TPA: septal ring lytic transglycosylase RlpA family protein [Conexibacter sp.]|nr:septal ring lytic transglycosylase RlpA family protein [Conexibacter sp.]
MTGRLRTFAVTLLALLALGVSVTSALAGDGAGGAAPGVLTLPDGSPLVIRLGNPLVQASGADISLAVRSTAMLRGRVRLTGTAASDAGTVTIERRDELGGWVPIASAAVAVDGRFAATWKPDRVGPLALRAVTGVAAAGTADDISAPQLGLTVYRPGIASWYGPTSDEETTACGIPLSPWTLGVAHRTLPCGTPVAFYYKGRTIVVPVIDRGPFVKGRSWDLTEAAHTALGGDDGLIRVGALPLPLPTATPARGHR